MCLKKLKNFSTKVKELIVKIVVKIYFYIIIKKIKNSDLEASKQNKEIIVIIVNYREEYKTSSVVTMKAIVIIV